MPEELDDIAQLRARFNKFSVSKKDSHSLFGAMFDFYHGLNDRNGYINVVGQGQRSNPWKPKEMSDAQIKRALLIAYKKGWTNVYFVKGGEIDQQTTNRAMSILRTGMPGLTGEGGIIERENYARQQAIEEKMTLIRNQMQSEQKELFNLHGAGKTSSPEAEALKLRMQDTQASFDKMLQFYRQPAGWSRQLAVGQVLPEKAFAHLSAFGKIPGISFKIPGTERPFGLAVPFTHAARYQSQMLAFHKAGIKSGRDYRRSTVGISVPKSFEL